MPDGLMIYNYDIWYNISSKRMFIAVNARNKYAPEDTNKCDST